jgi:hypothetical protein
MDDNISKKIEILEKWLTENLDNGNLLCESSYNIAYKIVNLLEAYSFERSIQPVARPPIVCLCGSTRFYEHFQRINFEKEMVGEIVLSVGFYPHSTNKMRGENISITPAQKAMLDEVHKRKIDLADYIYVLNIGGYIGESTRSEIEYAILHNKPVIYHETIQHLIK